jgi:hypothetical protein
MTMIISLPEQELLRIDGRNRRLVLHCVTGTVWLTDGSGRDCLLIAGKAFSMHGAETIVVEALKNAEVRLVEEELGRTAPAVLRLAVS